MTPVIVWKYTLNAQFNQFEMPRGAHVLTVAAQDDNICLWALVDPELPKEPRAFYVVPTGVTFAEPDGRYVGTALLEGGALVFHVFMADPE